MESTAPERSAEDGNEAEWRHWIIDPPTSRWMMFLSLPMMLVGLCLFAALAATFRPAYPITGIVVRPDQSAWVIPAVIGVVFGLMALTFGIFIFHEFCHGTAFRWAGATPRYGAKIVNRVLPIFFATALGCAMSAHQYKVVLLTPTVVVNTLGIALMWPPTLLRDLLVFPMAMHFAGCVGDWWMFGVVSKIRGSVHIEDTQDGFQYRATP